MGKTYISYLKKGSPKSINMSFCLRYITALQETEDAFYDYTEATRL